MSLDPNSSRCRATYALLLDYAGQWDASRREHELALALDPNNADAMVMYADFLLFLGSMADPRSLSGAPEDQSATGRVVLHGERKD